MLKYMSSTFIPICVVLMTQATMLQSNEPVNPYVSEKNFYLITAFEALSRLIPLLEYEGAEEKSQSVRLAAKNSMNAIAFIYWANSHSKKPTSTNSIHIDALSKDFYSKYREVMLPTLEDPLVLGDDYFNLSELKKMEFLELRYGGIPFPVEIFHDQREYKNNVMHFREWLIK